MKSLEKSNQVPDSSAAIGPPAWLVSLAGGGGSGHTAGGDTDGSGRTDNGKGGGGGHGRGAGVSAHALAMALLFFLHRLPEPLLTFRRREAFLSCEVGHRVCHLQSTQEFCYVVFSFRVLFVLLSVN